MFVWKKNYTTYVLIFYHLCLGEYIGTKFFKGLRSGRRRSSFSQYQILTCFLKDIENFYCKYPGKLNLTDVKVEYEQPRLEVGLNGMTERYPKSKQ